MVSSAVFIARSPTSFILILATFGLAAFAGLGRVPTGVTGVLVALAATAALLATLREIGLGLALTPFICIAVPVSIGTGTQSPLVAGLLWSGVLLGLWFVRSLLIHDFSVPRSLVFVPTLLLILVWTFSYLYMEAFHSPLVYVWGMFSRARAGQLGVVIVSAGTLLLALKVGRDLRWVKLATWTMIAFGTIIAILFYSHLDSTPLWRALSAGGLFTLWVVALSYGQALYNDSLPTWARLALILLAGVWLYKGIFLQNIWFSGWVPPLVAVTVITLFRAPKVFFPAVVVSGALVVRNWAVVHHALWDAKVKGGDLSRLGIWNQALSLFHQNPVLGTGPAGYAAYDQSIYFGSQYSMSTHSNYMDVLIETGVIGAFIFGWFLVALLMSAWQARYKWRKGFVGGFSQGAFGAFFGLLIAMSLGDWFIPFVYNQTIAGYRYTAHSWIFLGFLAAIATLNPPTVVDNADVSTDHRGHVAHGSTAPVATRRSGWILRS